MSKTIRRQIWEYMADREVTSQELAIYFGGTVNAWVVHLRDMCAVGYVKCVSEKRPKRYVRGDRVPYDGTVSEAKSKGASRPRRYVNPGVTIHGSMRPTGDADDSLARYSYKPAPEHMGEHQRWRQQPDQPAVFSTLGIGRYIEG